MKGFKRFFAEPPLRSPRFRVRGIGYREPMSPGLINRPNGTGDFLLMYFYDATRMGISLSAPVQKPERLFIWEPGDHQFYGHDTRRFLHSWIHCEGRAVEQFMTASKFSRRPLSLSNAAPFEKFLLDLHAEISGHALADEIIAENLFENWTRELTRDLAASTPRTPQRLIAVKDYIDAHSAEPLTLEFLAQMAHWSVAHFSEEFHRAFGTSPIDYVIQQRLHQASYLLMDVNLSVTEIARRVGYDDLYHFSKLFKRHRGVSPRQARAG